jgi:hypothetical protein
MPQLSSPKPTGSMRARSQVSAQAIAITKRLASSMKMKLSPSLERHTRRETTWQRRRLRGHYPKRPPSSRTSPGFPKRTKPRCSPLNGPAHCTCSSRMRCAGVSPRGSSCMQRSRIGCISGTKVAKRRGRRYCCIARCTVLRLSLSCSIWRGRQDISSHAFT